MERFRELSWEMKKIFSEAIKTGDWDTTLMFLEAGINPNGSNYCGWTPLHYAVNCDHPKMVRLLLDAGSGPNVKDQYVNTSLFYLSSDNSTMVKILLSAGADPNIFNSWGETSLYRYVTTHKYLKIVEILLLAGIDPNIKNFWGKTSLDYAKQNGNVREVHLLLGYGAK